VTVRGGEVVPPDTAGWANYGDRSAARRAAARRHHPDLGGSAEKMIAAFIEIDAHFVPGRDIAAAPLVIVVRRGAARRLRMAIRGWYRHRRANHYISI
jgi:hypothetical protein